MKFNKDTDVVKIEAYAMGYYSESEAYGEVYVPKAIYDNNKSELDSFEFSVSELDGKHSYSECGITITEGTIANFVDNACQSYNKDISESLAYSVIEIIGQNSEDCSVNQLQKLTAEIQNISKIKNRYILLKEDVTIEGILIPKDTLLEYEIDNTDLNNIDFEVNFDSLL